MGGVAVSTPECDWCNDTGTVTGYGYFPGGDPRTFSPDPEMNTPEEMAAWEKACAAYEQDETPDQRDGCVWIRGVKITRCRFGIGGYAAPCPFCEKGEQP